MTKESKNNSQDFEQILTHITEALSRVYSKANSELVCCISTWVMWSPKK